MNLTQAMTLIEEERKRQIDAEGRDESHDDEHIDGELRIAGEAYLINARGGDGSFHWPFEPDGFKPKDKERDLIRAGALFLAERERLTRLIAEVNSQIKMCINEFD